jgi:hypothetical protein
VFQRQTISSTMLSEFCHVVVSEILMPILPNFAFRQILRVIAVASSRWRIRIEYRRSQLSFEVLLRPQTIANFGLKLGSPHWQGFQRRIRFTQSFGSCTIQARRTQDLIGAPPNPVRTQYWIHQECSDSPSSLKTTLYTQMSNRPC